MSYIAWLDHSEHERRKMLDVIDLFREHETVDELGIGSVRDAFADILFPGTSTIQTRARYFLFVPWIYLSLEKKQVGSREIAGRARKEEVALIEALVSSGEKEGVIGIEARERLKRLPSNVYWNGLATWGIRRYPGPQDQYHRSLERFYRLSGHDTRNDDGEPISGSVRRNWDPGLPPAPRGFPAGATLRLTSREGDYLADRIQTTHPTSLLAVLATDDHAWEKCDFPWEHPSRGAFNARHQEQLVHAQLFSESIHGAPLLYNLMLAEKAENDELKDEYHQALANWAEEIENNRSAIEKWDQTLFWQIAAQRRARVGPRTQGFITHWLGLAIVKDQVAKRIAESKPARQLIAQRERALKGEQSRLTNPRALERWSGAAGTGQIDYRWRVTQTILLDILEGRGRGVHQTDA
jgi:hypothetical protein